MRKSRNCNTHRVKPTGQITTSRTSQKGCNKFRVKSQKTKITYKSNTIIVRPRKLVAPVSDEVQNPKQGSTHTKPIKQRVTHVHRQTAKANTANTPRKQKAI